MMTPNQIGPTAKVAIPEATPEIELLLACARTCVDPSLPQPSRFPWTPDELDWQAVLERAAFHRLIPALYWYLNQVEASKQIPPTVLDHLRKLIYPRLIRTRLNTTKLAEIMARFDEHTVRAIPFKGPALAAVAYPELWLRDTGDIDILVHQEDVATARRQLEVLGYDRVHATGMEESLGLWNCLNLYNDQAVIDLQWEAGGRSYFSPLDFEHIWRRLRPVTVQETTVRTLSHEDLLLLLCMHGSKHCWLHLSLVCDIAGLVNRVDDLDWTYIYTEASTLGIRRSLALGLFLAHELLALTLPDSIRQMVRNEPQIPTLAQQIYSWQFQRTTPLSPTETIVFNYRMKEQFRAKLHYMWHYLQVLLTPNVQDERIIELPRALSFLYYLIRPLRLMDKHLLSRWRSSSSSSMTR